MKKKIKTKNYIEKYNNEVHFRNNKNEPIHRWYPFVEGFSSNFVESIIDELDYNPSFCLDPFAGSGTTPLACQQQSIKCYSFEVNPFLFDLMKTKIFNGYNGEKLENIISRIDRNLRTYNISWEYPEVETQTLFEKDVLKKWIFNREVAWGVFDILNEIGNLPNEYEGMYKLLLKVALSADLVDISNVFRNGKCLSYKRNWQNNGISRQEVHKRFICFCRDIILKDILNIKPNNKIVNNSSFCRKGDARILINDLEDKSIDLVITSPPYLNSRDYTDIYRLELWILGYLKTYKDERELRKRTLRSHVQIAWHKTEILKIKKLEKVLKEIEKHREEFWNNSIPEMIKGYFVDMNIILESLNKKMKGNSKVYINVGNSSYFNSIIETDAIIAEIAEMNQFHVDDIRVARYLKSSGQQDSKKIRESVIVLTKS